MNLFIKNTDDQLWNVCEAGFSLQENTVECNHGVYSRKDLLTNTSEEPRHVTTLRSRFVLEGGEYEVYTQYNSWQNESIGVWERLNTSILARCESVRTTRSANPFLVLWSLQTGRGIAFHLLADASWSITASRVHSSGEASNIIVELGLDAPNLDLTVLPGESISLPEILYYEVRNKSDLDCWKLHRYCNEIYPRRNLPVIYNTWLYKFDKIDFENVAKQIPAAAELGAEYFVIDAGWFGLNPKWTKGIGDWEESMLFGFRGKMEQIAALVREHSMRFGLWLEVERAVEGANAPKEYSQYFIKSDDNYFLDFSSTEARDYIFNIVSGLITRYHVEFIKFDFNADLTFDKYKSAFTKYFKGYRNFIQRLKNAFPNVYFENCCSGGERMNLCNIKDFDSFWPTDNQSPYVGMRIFKDTILRLPPQVFERWAAITTINNAAPSYFADTSEHILSTGDAVWGHLASVDASYLKGFMTGGPLGFSCDLTKLSDQAFAFLKEHVATFKKMRNFWLTAECRILADTDSVLVLQYNDPRFKRIVIQVFTQRIMQTGLHVYPVTKYDATYRLCHGLNVNGSATTNSACENQQNACIIEGKTLDNHGLYIALDGNYKMNTVTLYVQEL